MLCRLCLVDDNNYQKLEGAICDILRAVLRKKYKQLGDSVICNGCVKKLEDAFDFITTSVRAQKIVSLYGGSDTKVVYVRDNKLCITSKNDKTIKLCKTCLTLIEHNLCINLLHLVTFDILDILKIYFPEVVIHEREPSLLCFKCLDRLRIFSEIINMANNTENMITAYCNEKGVSNPEQVTLDYLVAATTDSKVSNDDNIMKLLDGENFFDLENELLLTGIMEDSKKRIIKKIIEEDVDLFYKEKPDFDLDEPFLEESEVNSNQMNIFFNIQSPQLLLSDNDDDTQYKNSHRTVEETSLRHSFETEESSLSPGALSDRNFYECEEVQEDLKKDAREGTSPNPFIFFNDFAQNSSTCTCNDGSPTQKKTKRKLCDKCKWKKVLGYNSEGTNVSRDSMDDDDDDLTAKKSKKDGKKKCRKVYGIEFKELWCTQCRWKKACTRFGNTKAVNRR